MGAREVRPEAITEVAEEVAEKIDVLLERATDTVLGAPQPGSDAWQQAWAARDTDAGRGRTRSPHPDQGCNRAGCWSRPRAPNSSAPDVLASSLTTPPLSRRRKGLNGDADGGTRTSCRCGERSAKRRLPAG
ncbi:hypothetical protein GS934_00945 [Rhodococcus hoagii]|nr:hypothetical protein [Prescottella equi]NKZ86741.1 hypothetical protein [Prescottella equi]